MAAPSSSSSSSKPQRATASQPARKFSLEQANRALPLVKRIVADIVRTHALASSYREALERTSGTKETAAVQRELDGSIDRLQDLVDELSDVGVELKDYETGLVDFVGRHDGRDVYLCWKLGEERITHWHEINAGFAGRKPVSTLRERDKA
ncbi:MAG TPA: DUF2203 domain-containing protein [Tepidisphaeraceae bacterium]|nr:DUF2203 domain-containing protein [Tepidisphaeraceae bacterium]